MKIELKVEIPWASEKKNKTKTRPRKAQKRQNANVYAH